MFFANTILTKTIYYINGNKFTSFLHEFHLKIHGVHTSFLSGTKTRIIVVKTSRNPSIKKSEAWKSVPKNETKISPEKPEYNRGSTSHYDCD